MCNVATRIVCDICRRWVCKSHRGTATFFGDVEEEDGQIPCIKYRYARSSTFKACCDDCNTHEKYPEGTGSSVNKGVVAATCAMFLVIVIGIAVLAA